MDSYSRLVGEPPPAGRVQDEDRRMFIRDYLAEVHRTIQADVRLRGYFAWSLLDNFEWGNWDSASGSASSRQTTIP